MRKYLTHKLAKKLIIFGAVLLAIGMPLNAFIMLRIYEKAGSSLDNMTVAPQDDILTFELAGAYIATGINYVGLVLLVVGFVVLMISKYSKN